MRRFLAFLPVVLLGTTPAMADEVFLKSGGRLQGTVLEEGDRVVLRLENGTAKFRAEDVLRIVRSPDAADEYKARAAAIGRDANAHWELALWCSEKGLPNSARAEMEAVIAIDPEHAEARAKLGYEKVKGVWARGEALMVAKGLVKVDGRWVTEDEAAAISKARIAREAARQEAAKEAAEARVAALSRATAEPAGTFKILRTSPRTNRARPRHNHAAYRRYGYYRQGYGRGYPRTADYGAPIHRPTQGGGRSGLPGVTCPAPRTPVPSR